MFDLKKLEQSIAANNKTLPPIAYWQPERVAEIDIFIDSQMHWYHEGGIFERQSLVNLFSTILRIENNDYYLVTPVEKLKIKVADVPFLASTFLEKNGVIHLVCRTEDVIALDENANWQLRDYQGAMIPYVEVRDGLFARVDRHVYYQLVERAIEKSEGQYVLQSADVNFPLT